ncbi:MAG: UDP-2,4-diacetamido-2,4,6-trideoxy-beta-L-altropyranose hydrolase [Chloroflexi bacterium]|nr:UDP-2,4-diacetamido-2,4,6-trideoxy-beta-L-altropyranose hydrolase [Chloroflexota bacterium]
MTANGKVLFRVDADHRIGLGHLQRSLSLAAALRASGTESVFFGLADEHSGERVRGAGFPVSTLPAVDPWSSDDVSATLAAAKDHGCEAVVVDSHELGADYLALLRSGGLYVIARDDLALFPFPCQVVVNGNADAPQLPYRSTSGDTAFLLGPRYIVLGSDYQDNPPSAAAGDSVSNVLVILGGTDHYGLMPKILSSLAEAPGGFSVTAVIGPYFRNVPAVESAAEQAGRQITLVHSPDSVQQYMLQADLAISAAGQALYELAATACPTVAIQIASNQAGQMRAMEQAQAVRVAGNAEIEDVIPRLTAAVSALIFDLEARVSLGAAGRRLVDGQGAVRVAQAVRAALNCGIGKATSI